MEGMTENEIEQFAIELLERSGYQEGVRCRVLEGVRCRVLISALADICLGRYIWIGQNLEL